MFCKKWTLETLDVKKRILLSISLKNALDLPSNYEINALYFAPFFLNFCPLCIIGQYVIALNYI